MNALETTETQTSPAEMRGRILELESVMLKMPQVEIPIAHHFAPGIYLREMHMPKGAIVTGKIHKTEHYCILSKGHVTVVTEGGRREYAAPSVIHSMPGVKRALHAHEDAVWVNVHHNPTNEKDLEKIDELFVVDSYDALSAKDERKQIQGGV